MIYHGHDKKTIIRFKIVTIRKPEGGVVGLAGTALIVPCCPCCPSNGGWEQGIGGGENGGAAAGVEVELAKEVEPAPAKEAEVELGKELEGGGKVEGGKEVEEGGPAPAKVEELATGKVEPGKLVLLPTNEAAA